MRLLAHAAAAALLLTGAARAQSVDIVLASNPGCDQSGAYRHVDNLFTALKAAGQETEELPRDAIGGEEERVDEIRAGILGIFNTEKQVKTVSDMDGLRMRALDPKQHEMFEMMGASGVVVPFSEAPNAIRTGIANGDVNASPAPLVFGQADLFTHFTDARVIISARRALASTAWWDGLSEDEQAAFMEASKAAQKEVFDWVDATEATRKANLEKAGITAHEPDPAAPSTFKAALLPMARVLTEAPAERIEALRAFGDDHARN